MTNRIDTAAARRALEPRRDPYWSRIEAGAALGYRKLADSTGTWIARWRNHEGRQVYHALGAHADYDSAAKLARQWFAQCKGGSTEVATVEQACRLYVENRRSEKGEATAVDAAGRFRRHVYGTKFGQIKLPRLRSIHIEEWRNGLVTKALTPAEGEDAVDEDDEYYPELVRRAKDSANRDLTSLKAALNYAHKRELASSPSVWERVTRFERVDRRRERFLTPGERKTLIQHASPEAQRFLRAVLLTAARPGEIASAKVGDYDPLGLLTLEGKTDRRTVRISPAAMTLITACAGDRPDTELLVPRDDGRKWTKEEWRDALQEARVKAGLEDIVMYHLRHAAISEMIVSGIDVLTVARLAGTSVEMINKNYGHLIDHGLSAKLAAVNMLDDD